MIFYRWDCRIYKRQRLKQILHLFDYCYFLHVNRWTSVAERFVKWHKHRTPKPVPPRNFKRGYPFCFKRFTRPDRRNRYTLYRRGVGRTAKNQITSCSAKAETPGAGQVPLQKWLTGIEQTAPPPPTFFYTILLYIYTPVSLALFTFHSFLFSFSLSYTHTHTHTLYQIKNRFIIRSSVIKYIVYIYISFAYYRSHRVRNKSWVLYWYNLHTHIWTHYIEWLIGSKLTDLYDAIISIRCTLIGVHKAPACRTERILDFTNETHVYTDTVKSFYTFRVYSFWPG